MRARALATSTIAAIIVAVLASPATADLGRSLDALSDTISQAEHLVDASTWREQTCRFSHGDGFSTWEVRRTIDCAVDVWSVPGGLSAAVSVAQCESGADLLDRSRDGHSGTYQQATRYWGERRSGYNRAVGSALDVMGPRWDGSFDTSVFNARANVLVSIRMAHFGGWDGWGCA